MGFATTFRFGHPFFLGPTVDELFWRTHIKDNFSIISGNHNLKFGGEWVHSLNDQVFRGFFEGRYIFDSVPGFLRYASPAAAGGFGPSVGECFNSAGAFTGWVTTALRFRRHARPAAQWAPPVAFLQGADETTATDAGCVNIKNEDSLYSFRKMQVSAELHSKCRLRWEARFS